MALDVLGSEELAELLTVFLKCDEALAGLGASRSVAASVGFAVRRRRATVYVCGGSDGARALRSIEHLDPAEGRWEALPPMSQPRLGAAGAAVAGCLYVCGGCDGLAGDPGARNLKSAERFDPVANAWEELPDMLECRRGAVGAAIGRRLYVCGGEGGTDGEFVLSSVERFDPLLWEWEALPPMQSHRFGAAAAALRGHLCVCGGSVGLDALCCAEAFLPEANSWAAMPEMLEGRVGAAAASVHGRLYVCGGGQVDRILRTVECFCPEVCRWEAGPAMAEGFRFAAYTFVAGRMLVCGGQLADCQGQRSVRSIDLEQGSQEVQLPMSAPRMWPVALRVL